MSYSPREGYQTSSPMHKFILMETISIWLSWTSSNEDYLLDAINNDLYSLSFTKNKTINSRKTRSEILERKKSDFESKREKDREIRG